MLGRQAGLYEDELTVYRCLRIVNTGQWLDVLFTSSSEDFEVPELSHRTDIANALGLDPAELEALDTNADQRSGLLLGIPTPPEAPPDPDKVRTRELLSIPRSNWTAAQRAELLELIALEITR